MSNPNIEIIDDRDPRAQYFGNWKLGGVDEEYNSTTHGTSAAGSRVIFTFIGSSVEVFGTLSNVPHIPPNSTYILDGLSPISYSPTLPDEKKYRQSFYKSPSLEEQEHVLVITFVTAKTTFWLDYFQITPTGKSGLLPGPFSMTTALISVTATTPEPPLSTIPLDSPQLSAVAPAPSMGKATLIGTIIGSIVGGMIFNFLILFCILYYRRKKILRRALKDFSTGSNSISSDTHPLYRSNNRGRYNTRFIGDVSPFTYVSPNGSNTGVVDYIGTSSIPQYTGNVPFTVTASHKVERTGYMEG